MLFDPFVLRGLTLRNRLVLAPMCMYSVEACDGRPTAWHHAHYAARALGGFGLLVTEATAIAPEGRISPQDLGLWSDEQIPAWRALVDAVHATGGLVGPQLAHAGRKAGTYRGFPGEPTGAVPVAEGWVPVGPSTEPFPGLNQPHALTLEEVDDVVASFAAAARRAAEAGCDIVQVHAAHGYLLHQFLSPLSNHREDAYGGSFEGRTRLVLEVVAAVRAAVDDMPVIVRISGTDWAEGGWTIEESARLAPLLRAAGCDLVDVSSGGNLPVAPPMIEPGYQVPLAGAVHATGVPTSAVGLILDGPQAEQVLREGHADLICIGRPALHDPSWPLHAAAQLGLDPTDLCPVQYLRGRAPVAG